MRHFGFKNFGEISLYLESNKVEIKLSNKQISYASKVSLQDKISQEDYNVIQPFESRITIFTHAAQELMSIYSKKKQVKGRKVFGIIYLIIDWETGKLKIGRTERTLKARKGEYLREAEDCRINNKRGRSIIERINDLYDQGGNSLVRDTLEWIPIEVVLRTGHTDFDNKLIESVEQLWQNKLGTKDPNYGYDDTSGAAGRHIIKAELPVNLYIPETIINYRHLQSLLEKGCDFNQ